MIKKHLKSTNDNNKLIKTHLAKLDKLTSIKKSSSHLVFFGQYTPHNTDTTQTTGHKSRDAKRWNGERHARLTRCVESDCCDIAN